MKGNHQTAQFFRAQTSGVLEVYSNFVSMHTTTAGDIRLRFGPSHAARDRPILAGAC